MEWWKILGTADKAQVISAIATAIAAIVALITTWQNYKSTKKQEEERHAMIKPNFVVTGTLEDRSKMVYSINVENIGFNILNGIIAKWEGTEKANVEFDKYIEEDKTLSYVVKLKFDEIKDASNDIEGKLIIKYVDVLGKEYNQSINIVFSKVYNEISEKYYLCLKNIYGESFI